MVRFHGYTVIIKPAMFVLVAACITGAVAVPQLQKMPERVQQAPERGYLHPEHWRFEAKEGAEATIRDGDQQPVNALQTGQQSLFQVDMTKGVLVEVRKTTGTATVYLRNGFSLAEMKTPTDMTLRFEARADSPFPVLLTIRDIHTLVWHQQIQADSKDWKPYEIPLPLSALSARTNPMMVFAVQLGSQPGTVGVRQIKLTEQNSHRNY